jgi:AmmeMemoRadiSam system protein B
MKRNPAVAGVFYPKDRGSLVAQIEDCFLRGPGTLPSRDSGKREIIGGIVSNAGLWYCGPISAYFFKELKEDGKPDTFIIIGPDIEGFAGSKKPWVLYPSGTWEMPIGEFTIDDELNKAILREFSLAKIDADAHAQHSIEVILPFLGYLYGDIRFVPIIGLGYGHSIEFGQALARAIEKTGKDVVIIASSTGSHYEKFTKIRHKDRECINSIVKLDVDEFGRIVDRRSWNGSEAIIATITAAKKLGASQCKSLQYATNYEVTLDSGRESDDDSVIGYLSFIFRAESIFGSISSGTRIGRYEVVKKIGEGGMGIVFLCADLDLGTPVIVKTIIPAYTVKKETVDRFKREARMQARLRSHLHITTIYDVGVWKGLPFIAMEYVSAGNLRSLLLMKQRLSLDEAIIIFKQICSAISYAHSQGVIHRDLKPENILFTKEGNVKVSDFGLAKLEGESSLTVSGQVMGTLFYMSPEQRKGGGGDKRSDIYSLGVILFELLTSERPFEREDWSALFHQYDIPQEIRELILKALAISSKDRFQEVAEMSVILDNLVL